MVTTYIIDGGIHTPDDTKVYLEPDIDLESPYFVETWAEDIKSRFDSVVKKRFNDTDNEVKGVICLLNTNSYPDDIYIEALEDMDFIVYPSVEIQTEKIERPEDEKMDIGHWNLIKDKYVEDEICGLLATLSEPRDVYEYAKEKGFILVLDHPTTVDLGMSEITVDWFKNMQDAYRDVYKDIYYDHNAWVETLNKKSLFGRILNKIRPICRDEYTVPLKRIASTDDTTPALAFSGYNITDVEIDSTIESLKRGFENSECYIEGISIKYIVRKISPAIKNKIRKVF